MRKALLLGVFLAFISTSIVVTAIVSSKYAHQSRSSNTGDSENPAVGTASAQSHVFGTYPQRLKDGWKRKPYSSVVIFGASDCDDAHPRSAEYAHTIREGPPYWHGRYTNGPVFGEYLAASTLTGNNITLLNYAYGHATISNDLINVIAPDTKAQMEMYIDDINNGKVNRGNEKEGRVLHCVWIGKNDLIQIWNDVISNGTFQNGNAHGESSGFQFADKRINSETSELLNQIKNLRSHSKVNSVPSDFLIMSLAPLEIVPNLFYQSKSLAKTNTTLTEVYLKYIGDLSKSFNHNLNQGIASLASDQGNSRPQSPSQQNLMFMDIANYWHDIRSNPAKYDFVNVVDACWNSTTGAVCQEPNRWEYFDTLHATTKMHEYLAQEITVQVNL